MRANANRSEHTPASQPASQTHEYEHNYTGAILAAQSYAKRAQQQQQQRKPLTLRKVQKSMRCPPEHQTLHNTRHLSFSHETVETYTHACTHACTFGHTYRTPAYSFNIIYNLWYTDGRLRGVLRCVAHQLRDVRTTLIRTAVYRFNKVIKLIANFSFFAWCTRSGVGPLPGTHAHTSRRRMLLSDELDVDDGGGGLEHQRHRA